ncbi:MAG TPA: stalk domain-containing protein [Caldisericia bacterium]|nr:stalk domain-containing protein [Caldisericia bacterium]
MKILKSMVLVLITFYFVSLLHVQADQNNALLKKTNVFIPVAEGSLSVQRLPFYPLEDKDMLYILEASKELPSSYHMKLGLDSQGVQRKDVLGLLSERKDKQLTISVWAPDLIEEGRELISRWALGPALGDDTSSTVILQVFVYPLKAKDIKMVINSKEVRVNQENFLLDVPAQIVKGRTMVPFRFLGEQLGAKIDFQIDPETRLVSDVSFILGKMSVKLWINKNEAEIKIDRQIEKTTLDVPPLILQGRTLVPIRFVAEQLGAEVLWDAKLQEVSVLYPKKYSLTEEQLSTDFGVFFQDIDAKSLHESLVDKPCKIIDLRSKEDFDKNHLPGAIHLYIGDIIPSSLEEQGIGADDFVVVYCKSGAQSVMGAERLIRLGMKNVHNLLGGINSWPYETLP